MYEEALLDPKTVEQMHKLRDFAPEEYGKLRHDITVAKGLAYAGLAGVGLVILGAIVVHYRNQTATVVPPPKTA